MSHQNANQTVVITGASSGIGLGLARSYAASGANLVLNARNEGRLNRTAHELGRSDGVAVLVGDIGRPETGRRLIDLALERFGAVDVLVNNAGQFYSKPFVEYSAEDLDAFLSTHLKGTYLTSQAAVRPMQRQGGGAIVNITTHLAARGVKEVPASVAAAAKGGINALTRSLAVELAPLNIRVNAVAPGLIKTPIHGLKDDEFDRLNGLQPLGHVGEVEDVVQAVRYLAGAKFVTGAVLPVDGGAAAGG